MAFNPKIWFLILAGSGILFSCQTGGCPNCVNPKPEYYNAAKAKEARRVMRQHHEKSATGGIVIFEEEPHRKKEKKSSQQTEKKQKPIL